MKIKQIIKSTNGYFILLDDKGDLHLAGFKTDRVEFNGIVDFPYDMTTIEILNKIKIIKKYEKNKKRSRSNCL